ncbi:unnamed protein product [Ceratitis capitata]|uniref:(Mediterranean fruit fly) hypothetical protein n=1 Tax=Ceratitis capitata TaxID=7213 RepID=A0A811VFL9_CERCA|nr:unnamed protein product [Ceratitis capitata]
MLQQACLMFEAHMLHIEHVARPLHNCYKFSDLCIPIFHLFIITILCKSFKSYIIPLSTLELTSPLSRGSVNQAGASQSKSQLTNTQPFELAFGINNCQRYNYHKPSQTLHKPALHNRVACQYQCRSSVRLPTNDNSSGCGLLQNRILLQHKKLQRRYYALLPCKILSSITYIHIHMSTYIHKT